jgi:protein-tyrosine-phosphatase/DNA-binding transcriptional ArsR family regulator
VSAESITLPGFLRLAGHPVRWRLLGELARSDLRVGELCARVELPQNLVSYHLGRLRSAGVVSSRRSAADGRDSYYVLDLGRCGELLGDTGAALHPGLRLTVSSHAATRPSASRHVLFLCTGNSARSQIAEALVEHLSGGAVAASSAGSRPKPLHPDAVRAMRERGIDIGGRRTKQLTEFMDQRFDYVVTLCDRVREVCPEFPDNPCQVHWSIPDPAAEGTYSAFQRTSDELATRIPFLLQQIAHDQEVS